MVQENKPTPDSSPPRRHLSVESQSHFENENPNDRLVSTAGEHLFLVQLMGKTGAWQPLIGGNENGDGGVERGFDQPPPASSTCNPSLRVSSPPAGPFRAQARSRANTNLEYV